MDTQTPQIPAQTPQTPAQMPPSAPPFHATRADALMALFAFALGYLFSRWTLFSWNGWGTAAFTALYCASLALYLTKKGVRIRPAGWFWLAIVLLCGVSFALWPNAGLEPWNGLFLFLAAIYAVVSATGVQTLGKTSNWLALDGFWAMTVIPFGNFINQYKSFGALRGQKGARVKWTLSVLLGVVMAGILMAIVLPLLLAADIGGFSQLMQGVLDFFTAIREQLGEIFLYAILAIPISAYMFGLISGCAHRRYVLELREESAARSVGALRVLPAASVYTLLGLICALYVLFVVSQLAYFFSAFSGRMPQGFELYSEYARNGFFELCGIAAINLTVLAAANIMSRTPRQRSVPLKVFNILLSLLTLLLIATAFSKMALYIDVFGLSVKRLLPCAFMVFLALVCGGVIALEKWRFSIVRFAIKAGAVMLCLLCLINPDGLASRYNANRYLAGTLAEFDVEILYRAGASGVSAAVDVYGQTDDRSLRRDIEQYLRSWRSGDAHVPGTPQDTLQAARARALIADFPPLKR